MDDRGRRIRPRTVFGAATPAPPGVRDFQGKSYAYSYIQPGGDDLQGKLISPEFTVERSYINFLIAGGNKPFETCINLLVEGIIVRSSSPFEDGDKMAWQGWDVSEYEGKKAHIEIIDHAIGPWGHVAVDQIQFEDISKNEAYATDMYDFGTMSLALLQAGTADSGFADIKSGAASLDIPANAANPAVGSVTRKVTLQAGESHTATFAIAWHFPNFGHDKSNRGGFTHDEGRYYATRFADAYAVEKFLSNNFERLYAQTKTWHETWHDSTLPYWFLIRTLHNISTLATSTACRYADGQFYGWEGVNSCGGTCTHVWSYEQAMGRLFPEYDRLLRQRMELKLGAGLGSDGGIGNRSGGPAATDGHAGTILRTYRDHQTSRDNSFLIGVWPNVKLAIGWLIAQDGNNDGLIEGPQPNTMDETWYGASPWMSGLYLAALRAGEEMANDLSDHDFAQKCRSILDVGQKNFISTLWDEDAGYFFQKRDPQHPVRGSYEGCECDQVYGQSWAFQVGLGRVLPERETRQALASLYKYNFAPDLNAYSKECGSQLYALPSEGGLIICTWPQHAVQKNECNYCFFIFAGVEHQIAGHMLWEGMLLEGMALERAVHDRYHPSKRNPWNEIECGDHYARSMASYGVFVAACGFEYHGPRGTMAFAPRFTPENFRAAFTASEGWGTYEQTRKADGFRAALQLKWGDLALNTLTLTLPKPWEDHDVTVTLDGSDVPHQASFDNSHVVIHFSNRLQIAPGQKLVVAVS